LAKLLARTWLSHALCAPSNALPKVHETTMFLRVTLPNIHWLHFFISRLSNGSLLICLLTAHRSTNRARCGLYDERRWPLRHGADRIVCVWRAMYRNCWWWSGSWRSSSRESGRPAVVPATSASPAECSSCVGRYASSASVHSTVEMCRNGLQHSHSLPFPSVHSHTQSHCHDASDLIPIPVPLPKFIPIPSHSHPRLTNERHLSPNNQTM